MNLEVNTFESIIDLMYESLKITSNMCYLILILIKYQHFLNCAIIINNSLFFNFSKYIKIQNLHTILSASKIFKNIDKYNLVLK